MSRTSYSGCRVIWSSAHIVDILGWCFSISPEEIHLVIVKNFSDSGKRFDFGVWGGCVLLVSERSFGCF